MKGVFKFSTHIIFVDEKQLGAGKLAKGLGVIQANIMCDLVDYVILRIGAWRSHANSGQTVHSF